MSEAVIQHQMLQGNTGKILEAINNAEVFVDRAEISFPRIAVFGDESTGKSSVLEAICKIPFPRGQTTTTRCPTHIILQHKPGSKWSASAWVGFEGVPRKNETQVTAPEHITQVIRGLQALEVEEANKKLAMRGGAKFSHIPITISIEENHTVDLTLIDLPGYFTHQALDSAKGQGDVERIKQTLLTYLKDKNTILIVIVPANQLVKTANIFNLLKEYESNLSSSDLSNLRARTIYCFTKCDLVGTEKGRQAAPHNIEEILSNEGDFSAKPHGWYAVVNNGAQSSESDDFLTRIRRDRQFEKDFFDKNAPYNKPCIRSRCGIQNLLQTLSRILAKEISAVLPKMLSQTDSAICRAKQELKALGTASTHSETPDITFFNITEDIKMYFNQATEGDYDPLAGEAADVAPDISEDDLRMCELGYIRSQRCKQFKEQIKEARLPFEDSAYVKSLEGKVEKAKNGIFEETMPNLHVVLGEVRVCAKKWKQLAEQMCDDIANAAILCLKVLVSIKASKYERLPSKLNGYFEEMIEEQRKKAQNRLDWQYVDEIARPDTLHEDYPRAFVECKTSSEPRGQSSMDKAMLCSDTIRYLKAYLPFAEARFTDNAVRTVTTHIFDVPQGKRMSRVESEALPKFVFQAQQIIGKDDVKDLVRLRDDVGKKREFVAAKISELRKLREVLHLRPAQNSGMDGSTQAKPMAGNLSPVPDNKESNTSSSIANGNI